MRLYILSFGLFNGCPITIISLSSIHEIMMDSDVYREDVLRIAENGMNWNFLSGRNILVTGATGMIGSIIVDVLAVLQKKGLDVSVTALARNENRLREYFSEHLSDKFSILARDVNLPLDDLDFDTVIHCASNTHPMQYSSDPVGTVRTNVIGLDNLLSMCSKSEKGRFVFLSSVEVYGAGRGDTDTFDESYCGYIDCNAVRAGYNEAKRVGESLCQAYGAQYGLEFVIPRISRVYGPSLRSDDTKALSQFIHKAVAGEDIVLKSKGDQVFSYCYSADAAEAVLFLLINGQSGQAYNVAGKESDMSLYNLATVLADNSGVKVVFDLPSDSERSGYSTASRAVLDISKIEAAGWSPKYSITDGLKRTVISHKR